MRLESQSDTRQERSAQLTGSRASGMEKLEIFMFVFIASHYLFNYVFVSWLQKYFAPLTGTSDGLSN